MKYKRWKWQLGMEFNWSFIIFFFLRKGNSHSFKFDNKSWYKASKAGGGESSIQYKSSSNVFLTYWDKACATLFPPLLIQQTLDHYNPWIKWRISSTTLSNSEVFFFFLKLKLRISLNLKLENNRGQRRGKKKKGRTKEKKLQHLALYTKRTLWIIWGSEPLQSWDIPDALAACAKSWAAVL